MSFIKNLWILKKLNHKNIKKFCKQKFAGDLFNKLYYVYKLNIRDVKKFNYKKLRLSDDYLYESEEEI